MWSSVFLGAQAPFSTPIETITSLQFWNPKFWSLLYKHFAVKCYLTWHEAFFSLYPSSVDRFVGQCINIYTSCPQPHWVHDFSKNKGKKGRGRKEGGRERRKKGGKEERREREFKSTGSKASRYWLRHCASMLVVLYGYRFILNPEFHW